jgi:ribosomal protein S12 methylthiotransferase
MAAQQTISAGRLQSKLGTTIDVIVDALDEDRTVARSAGDAPEIDGNVYLPADLGIHPGAIVTVRVERADEYDLWAVPA